jgi:hypothetical protein
MTLVRKLVSLERLIVDHNSDIVIDIDKFLLKFWVALHMSDSHFGAPAGALTTPIVEISKSSAFIEVRARYGALF